VEEEEEDKEVESRREGSEVQTPSKHGALSTSAFPFREFSRNAVDVELSDSMDDVVSTSSEQSPLRLFKLLLLWNKDSLFSREILQGDNPDLHFELHPLL